MVNTSEKLGTSMCIQSGGRCWWLRMPCTPRCRGGGCGQEAGAAPHSICRPNGSRREFKRLSTTLHARLCYLRACPPPRWQMRGLRGASPGQAGVGRSAHRALVRCSSRQSSGGRGIERGRQGERGQDVFK